jgi:two-component system cell cycle response regulator DivK
MESKPRTILIVEDDEGMRSVYADALRHRGYRVLIANHGAEGVHLARRNRPDLILLDIRMPVMDGWGAAEYLKADPQTRDVPICAISAFEARPGELNPADCRFFDCFLMKPIEPRELVAEVDRRLGGALAYAPDPGAAGRFGG